MAAGAQQQPRVRATILACPDQAIRRVAGDLEKVHSFCHEHGLEVSSGSVYDELLTRVSFLRRVDLLFCTDHTSNKARESNAVGSAGAAGAADSVGAVELFVLVYAGHGRDFTGDWVLNDADIGLSDVLGRWHAAKKSGAAAGRSRLLVVSDACFSGLWVLRAGALAPQDVLVQAACGPSERALDGVFIALWLLVQKGDIALEFASLHLASLGRHPCAYVPSTISPAAPGPESSIAMSCMPQLGMQSLQLLGQVESGACVQDSLLADSTLTSLHMLAEVAEHVTVSGSAISALAMTLSQDAFSPTIVLVTSGGSAAWASEPSVTSGAMRSPLRGASDAWMRGFPLRKPRQRNSRAGKAHLAQGTPLNLGGLDHGLAVHGGVLRALPTEPLPPTPPECRHRTTTQGINATLAQIVDEGALLIAHDGNESCIKPRFVFGDKSCLQPLVEPMALVIEPPLKPCTEQLGPYWREQLQGRSELVDLVDGGALAPAVPRDAGAEEVGALADSLRSWIAAGELQCVQVALEELCELAAHDALCPDLLGARLHRLAARATHLAAAASDVECVRAGLCCIWNFARAPTMRRELAEAGTGALVAVLGMHAQPEAAAWAARVAWLLAGDVAARPALRAAGALPEALACAASRCLEADGDEVAVWLRRALRRLEREHAAEEVAE